MLLPHNLPKQVKRELFPLPCGAKLQDVLLPGGQWCVDGSQRD
jgi:hypothetical protein